VTDSGFQGYRKIGIVEQMNFDFSGRKNQKSQEETGVE
jgi:hypothetical protein